MPLPFKVKPSCIVKVEEEIQKQEKISALAEKIYIRLVTNPSNSLSAKTCKHKAIELAKLYIES